MEKKPDIPANTIPDSAKIDSQSQKDASKVEERKNQGNKDKNIQATKKSKAQSSQNKKVQNKAQKKNVSAQKQENQVRQQSQMDEKSRALKIYEQIWQNQVDLDQKSPRLQVRMQKIEESLSPTDIQSLNLAKEQYKNTYKPKDRSKVAYSLKRKLLLKSSTMTQEQKIHSELILQNLVKQFDEKQKEVYENSIKILEKKSEQSIKAQVKYDKLQKALLDSMKKIFKKRATKQDKAIIIEVSRSLNREQQIVVDEAFQKWKQNREEKKKKTPSFQAIGLNFLKEFENLSKEKIAVVDLEMKGAFVQMYRYLKKNQQVFEMSAEDIQKHKINEQRKQIELYKSKKAFVSQLQMNNRIEQNKKKASQQQQNGHSTQELNGLQQQEQNK